MRLMVGRGGTGVFACQCVFTCFEAAQRDCVFPLMCNSHPNLIKVCCCCCVLPPSPPPLSLRPVSPPSSIQFLAFISLTPLLSPTVSYRARLYHNQLPGISFFFWCLFSVDHWYFILFHHESGRLRGSRAPELNLLTDLAEKIKGRRSVFNFHTHTHSV